MIYVILGVFATLACLASFVAGGIAGFLFACACVAEEVKKGKTLIMKEDV